MDALQDTLNHTHPGTKVWGTSGGGKNGVAIVARKEVASFVSDLREEGIANPPPLDGCIFGLRISLPLEESFNIFSIYSSGQPEYRTKIGPALDPWLSTRSFFLGI